jgi:hypothetical protein
VHVVDALNRVDGLLLDPDHMRKDTDLRIKTIVQRDFAECIQQISLFPPGCEALRAAPSVVGALEELVKSAWSDEAKECARGALMQLTDRQHESVAAAAGAAAAAAAAAPLHVMMSYQWDCQATVERIVADLQSKGYNVWLDLERMKGSVMDSCVACLENEPAKSNVVADLYCALKQLII